MSYMVFCFGSYDVPDGVKNIATENEAMDVLHNKVVKWCKNHKVDMDDADYCEGDDEFYYGVEERGACIISIYEVPDDKTNKLEQYLWKAKMELEKANWAAEDYKWTLTDCCVDCYTAAATSYIDDALELIKK